MTFVYIAVTLYCFFTVQISTQQEAAPQGSLYKMLSAPPPYKIPIGWFLLEQDIISAAKGGVISKSECLGLSCVLVISLALSWRHLTTPLFTWVG